MHQTRNGGKKMIIDMETKAAQTFYSHTQIEELIKDLDLFITPSGLTCGEFKHMGELLDKATPKELQLVKNSVEGQMEDRGI